MTRYLTLCTRAESVLRDFGFRPDIQTASVLSVLQPLQPPNECSVYFLDSTYNRTWCMKGLCLSNGSAVQALYRTTVVMPLSPNWMTPRLLSWASFCCPHIPASRTPKLPPGFNSCLFCPSSFDETRVWSSMNSSQLDSTRGSPVGEIKIEFHVLCILCCEWCHNTSFIYITTPCDTNFVLQIYKIPPAIKYNRGG